MSYVNSIPHTEEFHEHINLDKQIRTCSLRVKTSLVAQTVKANVYNARDPGSIPGSGRSAGEGNGNPLQFYCLEKSHELKSLVGYSPWSRKELDTTERLHLFTYLFLL